MSANLAVSTFNKLNPVVPEDVYTLFRSIREKASDATWDTLLGSASRCAYAAFQLQDVEAEVVVHKILYDMYARQILPPWSPHWQDMSDPRFAQLKWILEQAWSRHDRERFAGFFGPLPEVEDFPEWATTHCQAHRSNVSHPLFGYLRDTASYFELREFLLQETPFDIHFGDLLALMLPGIYGRAKAEFSSNFWDEVGRGDEKNMHRQMRINMTDRLNIPADLYLSDIDRFCLEELRLANMYFHGVTNKALLPQAIGMMLATELMVPGRLDQQIQGWRRVGLDDVAMQYLIEHTVVDVEHAHGWMAEVVIPLLYEHAEVLPEIALGMARRLEYAGAVCDRMMELLPAVRASQPLSELEALRPMRSQPAEQD